MNSGEDMLRPQKKLNGPIQRMKSGNPPKQQFFLFHGWGADGPNLLDIAEALSHTFPDAEFHMPNAPELCENNTSGYQWFSLRDDSTPALMSGVESAAKIAEGYIREKSKEANVDASQTVLLGFSQGAMLSMHLALTRPRLCSVVTAYSGKLIDIPREKVDTPPPIMLAHGDEDIVIPVEAMIEAHRQLKDLGVKVDGYRMADLGHGINQAGLELGQRFILDHINKE